MNVGETIALIKALGGSGGSSLPAVTSADNGKVLRVKSGEWVPVEEKENDFSFITTTGAQPIPVFFNPNPGEEESYFTLELTPEQIDHGYSLPYPDADTLTDVLTSFPPYKESTCTIAYLFGDGYAWYEGTRFSLIPFTADNADGTIFFTRIMELDELGLTGMIGYLEISPRDGYDRAMRADLHYWSATKM